MNRGIQNLFSEVAGTYEVVNHVLTLGMDVLWRRKAAREAASGGGTTFLDVCTGTGETAVMLSRLAGNGARVHAVDFSIPMLREARRKARARSITFSIGEASRLPFPDRSMDAVTVSFATRNINTSREHLLACFREFERVLVPGGRFVNLETSRPAHPFLRKLLHVYVGTAVRPVGRLISGSDAGYAYLSATIPRFYPAAELTRILEEAGFARVDCRLLLGGVAAVHVARKGAHA
jgi:demethylmenaquinone methyltransferase/2-methoxy-6-polyprenyl-1,4-benzoquinol methylase